MSKPAASGPAPHAIVVGAGSAGLAAAAQLRQASLTVTVLEGGSRVGERWNRRYHSLRLNTLRSLSGLPGLSIPRPYGHWVSGANFASYLQQYASHHRLDVRTDTTVTAIHRTANGWLVETEHHSLAADVVVVATGHAGQPVWPHWPNRELFPGSVLHAAQYQRPERFAGQRVLVVGSGNSATEIAVDLVGHAASLWLSVRSAPLLVATEQLGISTHRISVWGAWLPDRIWDVASLTSHRLLYQRLERCGLPAPTVGSHSRFRRDGMAPVAERGFARLVHNRQIAVVAGTQDVGADGVRLSDGTRLDVDVVIAATGYRPDYATLLGHLPVLTADGRPRRWAAPLPAAPGLYIVGAPSLQGDIREHGREARRVARAVRRSIEAGTTGTGQPAPESAQASPTSRGDRS